LKPKLDYVIDPALDTLFISKEAREKQLTHEHVINATLGSFYDDHKNFYEFDVIKNAIKNMDTSYPYSPTEGIAHIGLRWLERLATKSFNMPHDMILTLGGTGALYLGFDSYLSASDCVISAIPMWNNNYVMLKHLNIPLRTFEGFIEGKFDLNALKQTLDIALEMHQKVMVLINDPAHNPTGYSLKEDEWISIMLLLESYGLKERILLMVDMAYLDFATLTYNPFLLWQSHLKELTILAALSASKSYSLYGARAGMLLCMSHDIQKVKAFKIATVFSARATYSLPSSFPFKLIDHVHEHSLSLYHDELTDLKALLEKRSEQLLHILNNHQIPYYTYHHGFFVTIFIDNPPLYFETLKQKGIYTIPVEKGLRFAVSALNHHDLTIIDKALEKPIRKE